MKDRIYKTEEGICNKDTNLKMNNENICYQKIKKTYP